MYDWLLKPKAADEDTARREFILNILLLGVICLLVVLIGLTMADTVVSGTSYRGVPPVQLVIIFVFFTLLLILSRRGFHRLAAYTFVGVAFLLATWPTILWGITLPQAILSYSLVIVMTGVLLTSSTAFLMAGLMVATLFGVNYLEGSGVIQYDTSWTRTGSGVSDIVAFGITFLVIALVAWLSNRETERSLARVRKSEEELLKQRQLLARKVKERTKDLERIHVEKILDLQRFAEFGRMSSTLLHELANPLMAVSLDLQQLEGGKRSKLVGRVRDGIDHMEQYVEAARLQLRSESEIRDFDVAVEIERVAGLLEGKARAEQVSLSLNLVPHVMLRGDSIRFNHIVANLITNAIDAYEGVEGRPKVISIAMEEIGSKLIIKVIDYGQGITKAQLNHMFEPFFTTKKSGTGIGLAITKQAVEGAFSGTVTATSSKRLGTQLTVQIPLLHNSSWPQEEQ